MVSKLTTCKIAVARQTGLKRLARSVVCVLATLSRGAIGWSVVCDCGIFSSLSLIVAHRIRISEILPPSLHIG